MMSFSTSAELYFKISVRPSGPFLHIESEIYFFGYFRVISLGVSLSLSKNPFQKSVLWSEMCILCHFLAFLPSSQVDRYGQIWVVLGLWLLCRDIHRYMLNFLTISIFTHRGRAWIWPGPRTSQIPGLSTSEYGKGRNMYFVPFSGIFAQLSGGPGWSDLSRSGFMASL